MNPLSLIPAAYMGWSKLIAIGALAAFVQHALVVAEEHAAAEPLRPAGPT